MNKQQCSSKKVGEAINAKNYKMKRNVEIFYKLGGEAYFNANIQIERFVAKLENQLVSSKSQINSQRRLFSLLMAKMSRCLSNQKCSSSQVLTYLKSIQASFQNDCLAQSQALFNPNFQQLKSDKKQEHASGLQQPTNSVGVNVSPSEGLVKVKQKEEENKNDVDETSSNLDLLNSDDLEEDNDENRREELLDALPQRIVSSFSKKKVKKNPSQQQIGSSIQQSHNLNNSAQQQQQQQQQQQLQQNQQQYDMLQTLLSNPQLFLYNLQQQQQQITLNQNQNQNTLNSIPPPLQQNQNQVPQFLQLHQMFLNQQMLQQQQQQQQAASLQQALHQTQQQQQQVNAISNTSFP